MKQGRTLRQPRHLATPGGAVEVVEVEAVQGHAPGVEAAQPEQQRGHGRLAAARAADQGDDLAAADLQTDAVEQAIVAPGIGQADALERDALPGGRRRRAAAARLARQVDQVEDALGGGQAVGAGVELGGQGTDGHVELGGEEQHGQRGAQRDRARNEAQAECHRDQGRRQRGGQVEYRARQEGDAEGLHGRAPVLLADRGDTFGLGFAAVEGAQGG